MFLMRTLWMLALVGCVASDDLSTAESDVGEPGPLVFHVPGADGDRLVIRIPGGEPVVAMRVDGELTAVASARDGDVAQIQVFDAVGRLLAETETRVAVPRRGLGLAWTSARGEQTIDVSVSNFAVIVTRGPAERFTDPTTLHADFVTPSGDRLEVRDVEWLIDDVFGTLMPDPRSYFDVEFKPRLERPRIDICAESRSLCWGITLPWRNGAGAIRRTGSIDTGIDIATVAAGDHAIVLRFVPQYPRAFEGYLLWNGTAGPGEYSLSIGGWGSGSEVLFHLRLDGTDNVYLAPSWFERSMDNPDGLDDLRYRTRAPTPTVNQWHHVAIVRAGSSVALYIDGAEVLTRAGTRASYATRPIAPGSLTVGIGPFLGAVVQFYGLVDDVGVFSSTKTDAEVLQLAQMYRLLGTESNLVAAGTFDGADTRPQIRQPTYRGESWSVVASKVRDAAVDQTVLPLPFQRSSIELPFAPGDMWTVRQEFDTEFTHRNGAAFCVDFERVPPGTMEAPGRIYFGGVATKGARVLAVANGTISHVDPTDYIAFPVSSVPGPGEYAYLAHLLPGSYRVGVGSVVTPTTVIAQAGTLEHVHFSIHDGIGPGTVTVPFGFSNYEVSRDYGVTWQHIAYGIPRFREWVRRPLSPAVLIDTRCLTALLPEEIEDLHCRDQ